MGSNSEEVKIRNKNAAQMCDFVFYDLTKYNVDKAKIELTDLTGTTLVDIDINIDKKTVMQIFILAYSVILFALGQKWFSPWARTGIGTWQP
jgi:uncharacterized protein YbcI